MFSITLTFIIRGQRGQVFSTERGDCNGYGLSLKSTRAILLCP